jgi:hypothetical protein
MRRLTWQIAGLAIVLVGIRVLSSGASSLAQTWGESLALVVLGGLLFVLNLVPQSQPASARASSFILQLVLWLLVFALGVLLRIWGLHQLPPDCIAQECQRALQLSDGAASLDALSWLARALQAALGDAWLADWRALRAAGALLGIAQLVAFFWAARQIVSFAGALLGMTLLALGAWPLWLTRSGDPAMSAVLWLTLFSGAILAFAQAQAKRQRIISIAGVLLLLVVGALLPDMGWRRPEISEASFALLRPLLQSDVAAPLSPFASFSLLPAWALALSILGAAIVFTRSYSLSAFTLSAISLATLLVVLYGGGVLALLLPCLYLCSVVALEQLLSRFDLVWRPLLKPATLLGAGVAGALLIGAATTSALFARLGEMRSVAQSDANLAMARYIKQERPLRGHMLFFAPPALSYDPAARLSIGSLLDSGEVRIFEPASLPYPTADRDLLYLIPPDEPALSDLLLRVYPEAELTAQPVQDGGSGEGAPPIAFMSVYVPAASLPGQPLPPMGLTATYYPGEQTQGTALLQRQDPVPGFPPTLNQPYTVLWQGKLAAVRSGEYLLGAMTDGVLSLSIDEMQLIDSAQTDQDAVQDEQDGNGRQAAPAQPQEGVVYLSRGWHAIEIRYTPALLGASLKLYWQPPGSASQPLHPLFLTPLSAVVSDAELPPALMLGLVDERLGMPDGFALSVNTELWQAKLHQPTQSLPALALEAVWQAGKGCGAATEQLDHPHGLALDAANGRIFVADSGNRRVVVYSLNGQATTILSNEQLQQPFAVAYGDDQQLWVLDSEAHGLWRLDPSTGQGALFQPQTSFYFPRGLALDSAGNLLVADTGGGRMVVVNLAGRSLIEYGNRNSALAVGQPVAALESEGNLWAVTAQDGRLWQLDTMGSVGALQATNTLDGPHLATLPDGGFIASDPARRLLLQFTVIGEPIRLLVGDPPWATPTGVASARIEGRTYIAVADSAACTVSLWRLP